jgi:hypothetical protein
MTENETASASQPVLDRSAHLALRRKKKTEGRNKRVLKLKTDKEFSKTYFERKSKRAAEKKSTFRKKKNKKK